MSSEFSDAGKLAAVQASPIAVAAHDKAAWLSLFAADALVNDPVGSRPHVGAEAISRFYDTFIAPNDIRFEVAHDLVCGNSVVRDLIIETRMSTGLRVRVPTHIRYELVAESGALRIRRLYAHWELLPMVGQTLAMGLNGWWTYAKLSVQMIGQQGVGGVLGFMRAFGGVGARGKAVAEQLLTALRDNDLSAVSALTTNVTIQSGDGTSLSVEELSQGLRAVRWEKLMAAGQCVTGTIFTQGGRGVILMEFAAPARTLGRVRLYL